MGGCVAYDMVHDRPTVQKGDECKYALHCHQIVLLREVSKRCH